MADVNIHAFSDTIMQGLMERLGIPIPAWIVRRRVRVTRQNASDGNNYDILVQGRDPDDSRIPFSLFKSIQIQSGDQKMKKTQSRTICMSIIIERCRSNSNSTSIFWSLQ